MSKIFFIIISLISFNILANEEIQIRSETKFTPTFTNRSSFMLGINPSMNHMSDIVNLMFSYQSKKKDYWTDYSFQLTNGVFQKLTNNNLSSTETTSDSLYNTKSSSMTLGAGLALETKYFENMFPDNHFVENISCDLTYTMYKESTTSKSFNGPGILAKFSLLKKFSEYTGLGALISYNLSTLKRAANNDTEPSSSRSLTMSYVTVGLDLSFYL